MGQHLNSPARIRLVVRAPGLKAESGECREACFGIQSATLAPLIRSQPKADIHSRSISAELGLQRTFIQFRDEGVFFHLGTATLPCGVSGDNVRVRH